MPRVVVPDVFNDYKGMIATRYRKTRYDRDKDAKKVHRDPNLH